MAQEWREILKEDIVLPSGKVLSLGRARTSKAKRLYVDGKPTYRFSCDATIGSMHYLDAESAWQDVDVNAEEPDTDGFTVKFTKLSYFGRIDSEGRRRFYPDRNDLSYWIEFKKPYLNMGTPTRRNRWFYWDFAHAVIGVRFDVDSLKFGFRLKDDQAPTSITIPFETQGITRQGRLLLHNGEPVAILRRPLATGSNLDEDGMPAQKECDVVFGPGEVTISLDPTGLEHPIEIDPTVDKQVGADLDDALSEGTSPTTGLTTCNADENTSIWAGAHKETTPPFNQYYRAGGLRFTDIIIPLNPDSIDVAHLTLTAKANRDTTTVNTKIAAEDAADPGAFVDGEDLALITQTTAKIDWDNIGAWVWNTEYNSDSIVTIIEELVGDYDYSSGAAMLFLWYNDGSSAGASYIQRSGYSHYEDSAKAAKLHIEYTVGGESYSLVIDAGSYAVTGTAAGLPVGRVMGAGAGAYALTGAAVDLLKDVLISIAAGSYTLAGSAVGLKRGLVIAADGGAYTLSGTTVSLLLDWILSASAGAYAITGTDIALLRALIMAAAGGSYALTGADVAFLRGKIMTAEAGLYVLTRSDIDLLKAMIIAAAGGTYTIAGQESSLRVTIGAVLEPIIGVLRAIDVVEGMLVEKDKTRSGLSTGRPKAVID